MGTGIAEPQPGIWLRPLRAWQAGGAHQGATIPCQTPTEWLPRGGQDTRPRRQHITLGRSCQPGKVMPCLLKRSLIGSGEYRR